MGVVIATAAGDVAFRIALGVLLLTVILTPIVRICFDCVRAARAWRLLENKEAVDVTRYSLLSEMLGDRGRWDAARVVAILLAAFQVSTWGLELSMDLAIRTDGPVDLLNRPPPIFSRETFDGNATSNLTDWIVLENLEPTRVAGTLGTFEGTLAHGHAKSAYRMEDGSIVKGSKVLASWSTQLSSSPSHLFFDHPGVDGYSCTTPSRSGTMYVWTDRPKEENVTWGTVVECKRGPMLVNTHRIQVVPPALLLNRTGGDFHLIVEEDSDYPNFLYSVWKPDGPVAPDGTNVSHVFHVSSTTRLAEAVVTGVANGITTGGGCVDLMLRFSIENPSYDRFRDTRVAPFGEQPGLVSMERLDQVDTIVAGILISSTGLSCGILLLGIAVVALVGYLCSAERAPLNVYDRDAVIRAVSTPNDGEVNSTARSQKIFISQANAEETFRMVISDDAMYRGCAGLRKRVMPGDGQGGAGSDYGDDAAGDNNGALSVNVNDGHCRRISRSWSLQRQSLRRTSRKSDGFFLHQVDHDEEDVSGLSRTMPVEHDGHPPASPQQTPFIQSTPCPRLASVQTAATVPSVATVAESSSPLSSTSLTAGMNAAVSEASSHTTSDDNADKECNAERVRDMPVTGAKQDEAQATKEIG